MPDPPDKDLDKQEVTSLFQIYGAIDLENELRVRTEEPPQVSRLLPVYAKPDPNLNWFRLYVGASPGEAVMGVDALGDPLALVKAALAFLAKRRPQCRWRARRLYAVSAAALTFGDRISDQELVAAALSRRVSELLPDEDAQAITGLLRSGPAGSSAGARDAWWNALRALIPDAEGLGERPSACSVDVSEMEVNGRQEVVPTFKTFLEAPISFDEARRFFDPLNWKCFPSWCEMKKRRSQGGVRSYREKVSFDCGNDEVLALIVNLDFRELPIDPGPPRVATLEYALSDTQPRGNSYVIVNQGWLEIVELREEPTSTPLVRITTTKSIKFTGELDTLGLASFLCLVGYAGMVEDLVCCATKDKVEENADVPFVASVPAAEVRTAGAEAPVSAQTAARSGTPAYTQTGYSQTSAGEEASETRAYPGTGGYVDMPEYGDLLKVVIEETASAFDDCIEGWAKGAQKSVARLEKGYTADELARDMSDWWGLTVREGARFANIWLRVARKLGEGGHGSPAPAATQRRADE
jgi:hypothetical protein